MTILHIYYINKYIIYLYYICCIYFRKVEWMVASKDPARDFPKLIGLQVSAAVAGFRLHNATLSLWLLRLYSFPEFILFQLTGTQCYYSLFDAWIAAACWRAPLCHGCLFFQYYPDYLKAPVSKFCFGLSMLPLPYDAGKYSGSLRGFFSVKNKRAHSGYQDSAWSQNSWLLHSQVP